MITFFLDKQISKKIKITFEVGNVVVVRRSVIDILFNRVGRFTGYVSFYMFINTFLLIGIKC